MSNTPEETARLFGVPVIPKRKKSHRIPMEPNPVVAVCGECGLCIRNIMGYSCANANCPTGLGGFTYNLVNTRDAGPEVQP